MNVLKTFYMKFINKYDFVQGLSRQPTPNFDYKFK